MNRPEPASAGLTALGELVAIIGAGRRDKAALSRLILQRWLAGELPIVATDERGEYVRGVR